MSLKLRYDVFGAEALGDATFVGKYEFPEIKGVSLDAIPQRVVPFDRIGSDLKPGDWLHGYVHDRRFYRILERREVYLSRLKDVAGFIGMDNSMYRDLPLAEQIHSCYLNRAVDRYLQLNGKIVVPNVSWGDWRTWEFCFDGVPRNSTIAMSTYGCCRASADKFRFEEGFSRAVKTLCPHSVVIHGALWPSLNGLAAANGVPLLRIDAWRSAKSGKEVR